MIESPLGVLAVLALVVSIALALETRYKLFRSLGSALVSILLAMLLSNLGVIPGTSMVYDLLGGPIVSAGIVLILLSVDLKSVAQAGPRMLGAFGVGAVGSAVGAIVAGLVLADQVGPETWKLAGQYSATYTGGGANFAAVGSALETSGELFAAGIAADVIMTAIWMATCLTVPVLFSRGRSDEALIPKAADGDGLVSHAPEVAPTGSLHERLYASVGAISISHIAILLTIVLFSLWAADWLAATVPLPFPSVLWLTTLALLVAQIPAVKSIRGAAVVGNYLVLLFLASNGGSSVVANIVAVGPPIFYFALITVAVHGLIIFGGGVLVGLDLKTLAVASQANVGGPASAMALASARGYTDRLLPGVAVGLLGYAAGNYAGFAVARLMQTWLGA